MNVDKRRTDACLKACEGISTQNLEDNVPFLELARRYNVVLRERDDLRAKIEQMEQQKPVAWMLNCPTLGGDTGWILSWTQSGAGLCNRLSGEENEKKLYALPGAKGEDK